MTEIEALLANWAKWCRQGNRITVGYPPESCTEMLDAIQYKGVGDTAQEHLDRQDRISQAEELPAQRMELWVSQLELPQKLAVRARYIWLSEAERIDKGFTWEQGQIERTRHMARWLHALGAGRAVLVDEYEIALDDGLVQLEWMHMTWGRGV